MKNADLARKNSTSEDVRENKNSNELAAQSHSSLESGAASVGGIYAAVAGLIVRGAEGLSDRRAERRMRRLARTGAHVVARAADR